jgi:predicted ATPase/serine/threonine protein kinase
MESEFADGVSTEARPCSGARPVAVKMEPDPTAESLRSLAHTLPPGLELRGYRIMRVLGEGGFGIVYLADDLALGRQVAIKEYLPAALASRAGDGLAVALKAADLAETYEHGLRSFVNEARLLVRFNHPALVKVHQFWEQHGTAYMVMPYYQGPTLRRVLADAKAAPSEAEIRGWLMPLLDALDVLHADHVFHRDIAPDNILLTPQGPVLLDFGAARRVIGDLTHALTAVLKPGYAPIEQYGASEDLKQGAWTDIFALASVLYLAISRIKPPPSVDRIVVDRLRPLSSIAAGACRPGFLAAIDSALAVQPAYRPQSVAQFRALLENDNVVTPAPALPGLLRAAPPRPADTRPAGSTPHNLPRQRTSFVGRETEIAEVKAQLDIAPLVTVLAMGGMGKTRLTLQVAADLLPRYPDGVWFVDLSVVANPALVVNALARALDIIDEPGRPLIETVCASLKARRVLLVVDNCEHVIEAAAEMVNAVLDGAPLVQVLASSREPLDVPGEQAYPLKPLPLPARDGPVQAVLQSPAVRMFADRARAHQPGFAPHPDDAPQLAELLNRLEGIPLAIELAAAQLRTIPVAEIVAGLDDRYRLLTGGSRLLQRRQQTLRALVDWSFDLLAAPERQVFGRLAVFAGGFDDDAARAVCASADDAAAADAVPASIAALVQKSLVLREGDDAAPRYRMLETLREYAREKLVAAGDEDDAARRHCLHYFALAKEGGRGVQGPEQGRWTARLDLELENMRAAAASALAGTADPLIAVKLIVALSKFWILRGHVREGRRLVEAALALPAVQASPMGQAYALYTGAILAENQGDHEAAARMLERCLALRRSLGNPVDTAATLSTLALTHLQAGNAQQALACETEALALFEQAGNELGQAIGHVHIAQIRLFADDTRTALLDLERSIRVARKISSHEVEAESELTAAAAHLRQGRADAAEEAARRSLAICRQTGDTRGEASATWWLGRIRLDDGEPAPARLLLQEALVAFEAHDMRAQMLGCLDDLCRVMLAGSEPASACSLAAAIEQARQRLKLRRPPWEQARWDELQRRVRASLGPEAIENAEREGRSWETDDAVRAAMSEDAMPTLMDGR